MPPEWEGLEAGEKAEEREQGAGLCSGDRDMEAWGRTDGGRKGWKGGRQEDGRSRESRIQ